MAIKMSSNIVILFGLILCSLATNVNCSKERFRIGKIFYSFEKSSEALLGREANGFEEKWFAQNLDHFKPRILDIWKQRYITSSKYSDKSGPIFLEIGGEGKINGEKFINDYMAENLAREFKAHSFILEHRFYGQSQPFEDWSVQNLQYLSSEQALADLANFIQTMSLKKEFEGRKWIIFGGSYAGSLSAWMRLKYPHLVSGSISSSAPVQAQLHFPEYMEVVEQSLGEKCSWKVKKAFNALHNWIKSSGTTTLIKLFNLCDLDINSEKTVASFFSEVIDSIAGVVQYNKDNRKGSNVTIDMVCDLMISGEGKDNELDSIKKLSEVYKLVKEGEKKCKNVTYAKQVEELKNLTVDFNSAGRQWYYQTCNEFGYYQTTSKLKDPFPRNVLNLEFFVGLCSDVFGIKYTEEYIREAIRRTNIQYGGRNLKADNVFLLNGSIDPWHALGLTDYKYLNTTSYFIKGTAHCADMYPPRESDEPELKLARKIISERIKTFLA